MPPDNPIHAKLDQARQQLLDLSLRNRLLNTSRHSPRSRSVEVVDELSEEVFRILVRENKTMSFLSGRGPTQGKGEDAGAGLFKELPQPDEPEVDEGGVPARHTDSKLQTALTPEGLQKRLLGLYYDARTFEEEQGVNILYLAIGFLKWYESDASDKEVYAPLLLIPMGLERQSATERFKLRYLGDEISTNVSLQALLKKMFAVDLPEVPDSDDISLSAYFQGVVRAVSGLPRWEVRANDIVLGFFSFAKFLMYRDLDPSNWPADRRMDQHPLVSALLETGFRPEPDLCGETDPIDPLISPLDMVHVLDADSSQAIVIEEVMKGRNLVIQGPPGTGKSQTISNLIAAAVKKGKKVLFVAEKMAALEVVKRRLDNVGLGGMCLELHSHKANKRRVLEELRQALALGRPASCPVVETAQRLKEARDRLNRHCEIMHRRLEPSGMTAYQVIGRLVGLNEKKVSPPDYVLADPHRWAEEEVRGKVALLADLVLRIQEIGAPAQHPWRGVMLEAALPMDMSRLVAELPRASERLGSFIQLGRKLAAAFKVSPPQTVAETLRMARLGQRLAVAPPMDRFRLAEPAWRDQRKEISDLAKAGREWCDARARLKDVVRKTGWSVDAELVRRDLAAHGRSLFRLFKRSYRQARRGLRDILVVSLPGSLEQQLSILDALIAGQAARAAIAKSDALGSRAFGSVWRREDSDWGILSRIEAWEAGCREADLPPGFSDLAASLVEPGEVIVLGEAIAKEAPGILGMLQEVFERVHLDLRLAFDASEIGMLLLSQLKERLEAWRASMEGIQGWIGFRLRFERARAEGMSELAQRLFDGRIRPEEAMDSFLMAYLEVVLKEATKTFPEISTFDGRSHEQLLAEFKGLDEERINLARQEVALAHYEKVPRGTAEVGEVGIVHREINKQRRHLPLRQHMKLGGRAIQAIKPVFMMSPMSIAQYLEPGAVDFDLLLIDEASQVQPVDALGAVARARQIVVVGDDNQLPPTAFFSKIPDDDVPDEDAYAGVVAGDMESILRLCKAQRMAERMLRWHYRSRHHSLIVVSNREFYENRLYVVPSPYQENPGLGVRFHHMADGVFDRGASRTNRAEAKAVARAVIEHARQHPELSLGVGTFSISQKQVILDELEQLWRSEVDVKDYFGAGKAEPFFVKNLENIQGDERDVIFISVGYGRDASGFISMNFGPLSVEGGQRRLNVLITRARRRCEVFSSITANDIDLNRASGHGVRVLKLFLSYAQTGRLEIAAPTGVGPESEFEEEVARVLTSHGHRVDLQVGTAGFRIDLAVADPDQSGRYLLGIECDGKAYHSSRSARDRDRLRQQVLEDQGWIIHRIWSTDWFHRPEEQLRKVLAAIERAKLQSEQRDLPPPRRSLRNVVEVISGGDPVARKSIEDGGSPQGAVPASEPYKEASFRVPSNAALHDLPLSRMVDVVRGIVETEGPIHQDEVARRVTSLWGLQRTGNRIQSAVFTALKKAATLGTLRCEGAFYRFGKQAAIPIRNRENVNAQGLRDPEMLPPVEIRAALLRVVESLVGVRRRDAVTEASRLLGYRATSAALHATMDREVTELLSEGTLMEREGVLYPKVV